MNERNPFIRHSTRRFESRHDGEYCLCTRCMQQGYEEDSWQPLTTDFWPVINGALALSYCRACTYEKIWAAKGKKVGFVTVTDEDRAWLVTAIASCGTGARRRRGHDRSANTTVTTPLYRHSPTIHSRTCRARAAGRSAAL